MKRIRALIRRVKGLFCKHTVLHVEEADTAVISNSINIKAQCLECGKSLNFALEKTPIVLTLKSEMR